MNLSDLPASTSYSILLNSPRSALSSLPQWLPLARSLSRAHSQRAIPAAHGGGFTLGPLKRVAFLWPWRVLKKVARLGGLVLVFECGRERMRASEGGGGSWSWRKSAA